MSVQASEQKRLLIAEVKLGGAVTGQPTEFVKIYNESDHAVDASKMMLEYAKSTANITNCDGDWRAQDSANVRVIALSGDITTNSLATIEIAMNDNAGGSLRLRDDTVVYDVVGWGKEGSVGKCSEDDPAPVPSSTKSIRRFVDRQTVFLDSNNNAEDFVNNQDPVSDVFPVKQSQDPCAVQHCEPIHTENTDCSVIELSEILPNPSGSDTNNEYIELHNPTTKTISLSGCSLSVGSSTKKLDGEIVPGYKAIYGLTLPNAAGGTVQLVSSSTEEAITYPEDLADDEAWALVNGSWQVTNQPTPNQANIISEVVVGVSKTSSIAPCPEGKYRNPETNRCKSYATTNLKSCSAGQVRNPETNRCRKLTATALTSLKPCSAGQVRNPATNRCKKIAASTLKPCKEGQERNPETNRCRNVAGASTSTQSTGNDKPQQASKLNMGIFALLALAAGGYGIYEYRNEIGARLTRLKSAIKK